MKYKHLIFFITIFMMAIISNCTTITTAPTQQSDVPSIGPNTPALLPDTITSTPSVTREPTLPPQATSTLTPELESAPDGQLFYVQTTIDQGAELVSVAFDGKNPKTIASCRGTCSIIGMALNPQQTQLVYMTENTQNPRERTLYRIAPDGSDQQELTNDIWDISRQAFSPNGKHLVFSRAQAAGDAPVDQTSLWVMDLDTKQSQQLIPWSVFVEPGAWEDDQHIVFSRADTGTPPCEWQSYRVTVADQSVQQLAKGRLVQVYRPRTEILLLVEPQTTCEQRYLLSIVDQSGQALVAMGTTPLESTATAWSADGTQVALYNTVDQELQLWQIGSNRPTTLLTLPDGYWIDDIAWHPDGQNLVYTERTFDEIQLSVLNISSQTTITITTVYGNGTWAPVVIMVGSEK